MQLMKTKKITYSLRLATAVLIAASMLPLISPGVLAKEIRVAVASNFNETMKEIVRQFEMQSGDSGIRFNWKTLCADN